ncbi:MAG: TIGR02147 family protein [Halobacteriovoraceae bacterium]|nr:TIGR02147 family protein [Halobacteriovoraceae bacterium]
MVHRFKSVTLYLDMSPNDYIRQLLNSVLEERKLTIPKYSLRDFAKSINIQPAALSSYLKCQRNFSQKKAVSILQALQLPLSEIHSIEEMFHKMKPAKKDLDENVIKKKELESQNYFIISDPNYYTFLNLIQTKNFKNDNEWISKRLGISIKKIKDIKKVLQELKLIQINKEGLIKRIEDNLASTDNIANYSLRIRHQKNMEDSKNAIKEVPMEERYFGFETLSFDKNDLPLVQKKINALFDDLIWLSQKGKNKTEVYEFCSHYFPRTKKE